MKSASTTTGDVAFQKQAENKFLVDIAVPSVKNAVKQRPLNPLYNFRLSHNQLPILHL
jgi:hypothetical protein